MSRTIVWRAAPAVLGVAAWAWAAHGAQSLLWPSPMATARALAHLVTTPSFWRAIADSHATLTLGLAASLIVGIPAGLMLGRSAALARWIDPYLDILMATPMAAVMPLLIMAAGLSLGARALVVCAFALPVVIVTIQAGTRSLDPRLMDMARAFGATHRQIVSAVVVPSLQPSLATAVRLGLARAFAGLIVSELVLTATGLGGLSLHFQSDFDAASVFAVAFVLMAEAVMLMSLATHVERRVGVSSVEPANV